MTSYLFSLMNFEHKKKLLTSAGLYYFCFSMSTIKFAVYEEAKAQKAAQGIEWKSNK